MLGRISLKDRLLNQKVMRQLSNRGVRSPCEVTAAVSDGSVTLSGQIEHEFQRRSAVRAAQNIAGVKRVVDQLHVVSKTLQGKRRGASGVYVSF
jgi:osmotically-inducible protein OsmY